MGSDVCSTVFKQLDFDVLLEEPVLVKPLIACADTGPLFLSNIDQVLAFTVETLYFYGANPEKSNETVAEVMKAALAKALVHYDVMAGRARFNESEKRIEIDRNYKGVQFAAASCNVAMSELGDVTVPHPSFRKFVPQAHNASTLLDIPLMMIQVTTFPCGGFAIGFGMSHLLWDGMGCLEFLMNLMSFAKGGEVVYEPKPDRSMLKARNPPITKYEHPEYMQLEDPGSNTGPFTKSDAVKAEFRGMAASQQFITKTIPFTLQELTALKNKANEDGILSKVSTFEALSGHVWQARAKALDSEPTQMATLLYAVDIRNRLEPNLPEHFCGNGVYSACARATSQELQTTSLSSCVKKIQEANQTLTDDYIRSGLDWLEVYRGVPTMSGDAVIIASWLKMPFFAIDFGWGAPLYGGPVAGPLVEFILFLPNGKHDRGVNMILSLPPQIMTKFEKYVKSFP